jgi:hypothetical protein
MGWPKTERLSRETGGGWVAGYVCCNRVAAVIRSAEE